MNTNFEKAIVKMMISLFSFSLTFMLPGQSYAEDSNPFTVKYHAIGTDMFPKGSILNFSFSPDNHTILAYSVDIANYESTVKDKDPTDRFGIWRSIDKGNTWKRIQNSGTWKNLTFLTSQNYSPRVIAFNDGQLMMSDDSGENWTNIAENSTCTIFDNPQQKSGKHITLHQIEANNELKILFSKNSNGIVLSDDGGLSCTKTNVTIDDWNFFSSNKNNSPILASHSHLSVEDSTGILISKNQGKTWRAINKSVTDKNIPLHVFGFSFSLDKPNSIYGIADFTINGEEGESSVDHGDFIISDDNGESWTTYWPSVFINRGEGNSEHNHELYNYSYYYQHELGSVYSLNNDALLIPALSAKYMYSNDNKEVEVYGEEHFIWIADVSEDSVSDYKFYPFIPKLHNILDGFSYTSQHLVGVSPQNSEGIFYINNITNNGWANRYPHYYLFQSLENEYPHFKH